MVQKFGPYTIFESIGKGGMSIVYRATQESIGREVAVKVLLTSLVEQDKTFLERFYREVQIAAKLQHPHILPVYDFGVHEGQPYIVMAYLRGGTLSDRIKQGPMSLAEVLSIILQVAGALDFAHHQGIIHRDIKPSNVMLDVQGNGYLADFGLAKVGDAGTELTGSRFLGTPDYMAPDFSQEGGISPAVDIYALGVTIFQMLTGQVPFRASSPMGVLMAHMTQPAPDVRAARPDLPETIQQVISTAMAKKPNERYPSAGILYEALKTASKEAQNAPHALLFTDFQRHVIFVNSQLLQLLKRSEIETRQLVGKPLEQVLGIEAEVAKQLIQEVAKIGHIYSRPLTLRDASGSPVEVYCTVEATYNEKGECLGADLSLRQSAPMKEESLVETPLSQDYDSSQRSFLQLYVTSQLDALRVLVNRVGGPRLGKSLERVLNETSERNGWPVRFNEGRVEGISSAIEPTVYQALLVKAIHYGVNVIGAGIVEKQLKAVEDQMGPRALEIASRIGLREIIRQQRK